MKKLLFITILLLTCHALFSQQQSVNLRGQVRTIDPSSRLSVPLPKITVDLYKTEQSNGRPVLIASSYSDDNGFYYFHRIPHGSYFIQVNKRRNFDIRVAPVNEQRQSFLDLPVLKY